MNQLGSSWETSGVVKDTKKSILQGRNNFFSSMRWPLTLTIQWSFKLLKDIHVPEQCETALGCQVELVKSTGETGVKCSVDVFILFCYCWSHWRSMFLTVWISITGHVCSSAILLQEACTLTRTKDAYSTRRAGSWHFSRPAQNVAFRHECNHSEHKETSVYFDT